MAVDVATQSVNSSLKSEAQSSGHLTALLHELQLGEQLNESVHQARRADFSLMLAMLSNDVREQSQFILPKHKETEQQLDDAALRKQFDLPKPAPLAIKNLQEINAYNQGNNVAENDVATIRLTNSLSPKPLAFRDNAKHIAREVMSNTSLVCQAKHAHEQADAVLNKRLAMNVEGWLKNIQTSLVKSRLVPNISA